MSPNSDSGPTELLRAWSQGDGSALDRLVPQVYEELHRLAERYMRQERPDHTLQATSLVNEAYLKLLDQSRVQWQGRTHFFAVGAQAMRRILVDHARRRQRLKHGGQRARVTLDEGVALTPDRDQDVLALDEALVKLAKLDERQAKVVELRFFAGLTVDEVADVLDVSKRTVEVDWTMARAWLHRERSKDGAG